jgi:FixJ family two-component response regulator
MFDIPSFSNESDEHLGCEYTRMRLQRKRSLIAIVDDDTFVCRAVQRMLASRDIDSELFTSGRGFLAALETVPSFQPECVILDMHMPDMHGLDVLKQLARTRPDLPVVALTAQRDAHTHQQALAWGAVAFFEKPLDEDIDVFVETLLAGGGRNMKS